MANVKEVTGILFGQYLGVVGQIKNLQEWEVEKSKTVLTILKETPNALITLTRNLSDKLYGNHASDEEVQTTILDLRKHEALLQFGLPKLQFMTIQLFSFTLTLTKLINTLAEGARPRALNLKQLENMKRLLNEINEDIDKVFPRANKLAGEMTPKEHLERAIRFLNESNDILSRLSTNLEIIMNALPNFRKETEKLMKGISPEKYAQIAPKIS